MSEPTKEELAAILTQQSELIECVEEYVYDRYSGLTPAGDFDEDDLKRLKLEDGFLCFLVKDVRVTEVKELDRITLWYVHAAIEFEVTEGEPIEGTSDLYQCYKSGDTWVIEWHSS